MRRAAMRRAAMWRAASAAAAALLASVSANHTRVDVSCCALWRAMQQFVAVSTGESYETCPRPCKTNAVMTAFAQSLGPPRLHAHADPDLWYFERDEMYAPDSVANVLAWSVVGRLCAVGTHGATPKNFLQINTGMQTISVRRTGCEYERTVYSTLLMFCTAALAFVLFLGLYRSPEPPREQPPPSEVHTQASRITLRPLRVGTRYRALPVAEYE
jgi:hypothetical protein